MEYNLEDLIKSVSVKHNFPNNQIIFLNTSDIEDGTVLNHSYSDVKTLPGQAKKSIMRNDILYSEIRPKNKRFAFIDYDSEEYVVSTKLMVLRVNDTAQLHPKYLYYYLTNKPIINHLQNLAESRSGTFPQITFNELKKLKVNLPTIEKQHKIISFMDSINGLITNNNQSIANLEELSQTLFKRWFIDFEFPDENGSPYKSSKGKMKKSSIGEIPAHWEITDIQEMTTKFTTGLNPRKNFTLGEGSNYYVTIKNMGNNDIILDERCDKVTDEAIEIINKRSDLQVGDVLFSGIGTIGRTYLIYKDPHNWNTSESIFSLRPSDKISSVYLYNLLLSEGVQDYSVQMSSGSVQKGIRKRDLERYTFALSNDNIEDYFEELVSPLQNKIHNLRDENLKLVELRDTLLPKLMSGEVELPDELEVDEHAELLQ